MAAQLADPRLIQWKQETMGQLAEELRYKSGQSCRYLMGYLFLHPSLIWAGPVACERIADT